MSYTQLLDRARYGLERKEALDKDYVKVVNDLAEASKDYYNLLEVQRLLSRISEENTVKTLDFITGVINKTLKEIFQGSSRHVYLEKKLHAGRYAHIVVQLEDEQGNHRDLDLQTGSGVKEVISFLFLVCLVAVRGGRKFVVMDELLSGLHRDAKKVVADLMKIFAEEGFQFLMVEYGLNDVGKIYNVETRDGEATLVEIPDGGYTGDRFVEVG